MTPRSLIALVCMCSTSAAGGHAVSDETIANARAADEAGRKHFNLREYAAAIADYRRAFQELPDPLFLFNIAQSYRLLHDCENAGAMYRTYLREKPEADNRAKVEQFIAEMDRCVAMPTPLPPSEVRVETRRSVPLITGGVAAAIGLGLVGAGIYFSSDGSQRARQLEDACASGCDGASVASIDRAGKRANRYATVSYVAGGLTLAAGATLMVWAWRF